MPVPDKNGTGKVAPVQTRVARIFADPEALSVAAAQRFVDAATEAITARGRFCASLSGGSTPKRLYQKLVEPSFIDRVDWSKVDLFFGDERCVPRDHPDSNYRMVHESLFNHAATRQARVFAVPVELAPEKAADAYADMIKHTVLQAIGLPRFDFMLLGVGADGHTASLFPGSAALDLRDRLTAAVYSTEKGNWRITLTLPTLNNSAQTLVLLEGSAKSKIVAHLCSNEAPVGWPIEHITPRNTVEWYVDAPAASEIKARKPV